MGGKKKSSSFGFLSMFNIFKSKKKQMRGGYYDGYENGMRGMRIWPSDEDAGRWGVADPTIDKKAAAFIAHKKKRVFESA